MVPEEEDIATKNGSRGGGHSHKERFPRRRI
jgi:hypothetical protein